MSENTEIRNRRSFYFEVAPILAYEDNYGRIYRGLKYVIPVRIGGRYNKEFKPEKENQSFIPFSYLFEGVLNGTNPDEIKFVDVLYYPDEVKSTTSNVQTQKTNFVQAVTTPELPKQPEFIFFKPTKKIQQFTLTATKPSQIIEPTIQKTITKIPEPLVQKTVSQPKPVVFTKPIPTLVEQPKFIKTVTKPSVKVEEKKPVKLTQSIIPDVKKEIKVEQPKVVKKEEKPVVRVEEKPSVKVEEKKIEPVVVQEKKVEKIKPTIHVEQPKVEVKTEQRVSQPVKPVVQAKKIESVVRPVEVKKGEPIAQEQKVETVVAQLPKVEAKPKQEVKEVEQPTVSFKVIVEQPIPVVKVEEKSQPKQEVKSEKSKVVLQEVKKEQPKVEEKKKEEPKKISASYSFTTSYSTKPKSKVVYTSTTVNKTQPKQEVKAEPKKQPEVKKEQPKKQAGPVLPKQPQRPIKMINDDWFKQHNPRILELEAITHKSVLDMFDTDPIFKRFPDLKMLARNLEWEQKQQAKKRAEQSAPKKPIKTINDPWFIQNIARIIQLESITHRSVLDMYDHEPIFNKFPELKGLAKNLAWEQKMRQQQMRQR